MASFLYGAQLAVMLSVLASVPLGLLHLLRRQMAGRGAEHGEKLALALVVLASLVPSWEQADFLTSGASISQHPWVRLVRWSLFGILVGSWSALWLWHRAGVSMHPTSRWRQMGWLLFGALGCALLLYGFRYRFAAYQAFAYFLLPALWLLAASVLFVLLWRLPMKIVVVLSLIVVGMAAPGWLGALDLEGARNQVHADQRLAALSDGLLTTPTPSRIR